MKNDRKSIYILIILAACISVFTYLFINKTDNDKKMSENNNYAESNSEKDGNLNESEETESEFKQDDLYVTKMSEAELKEMWRNINNMPFENPLPVNTWKLLGPSGSFSSGTANTYWSGRMLDVKIGSGTKSWFATASGGLWESNFGLIYPIGDIFETQVIGTVDTKPGNENVILVGTGEPNVRNGFGYWKTTNGGSNWTNISISPNPGNFFKIRFFQLDNTLVYAAAENGFYKSTNSGDTWSRVFTGRVSDFAMNPININMIYIGVWNSANSPGGIYKSVNGGSNWAQVFGVGNSNIGNTSVSLCEAVPNTIYASFARNDNQDLLFVAKSTDGGSNWINLSSNLPDPPSDIFRRQGDYDNVISVSPNQQNIVLFGGVGLYRTSDGGNSWVNLRGLDENVHADNHVIRWSANGNNVWVGSDGGLEYSNNQGQTGSFSTNNNYFPITQFTYIDVSRLNNNYIIGGTQDNGVILTSNRGNQWSVVIGGDGGGTAFHYSVSGQVMASSTGPGGSVINFRRNYSGNWGVSFSTANTGIDTNSVNMHWMPPVRSGGSYFYTAHLFSIYRYVGASWVKLNASLFPYTVSNFDVSSNGNIIYAALNSQIPGSKFRVYDGGSWYERSNGIASNVSIRNVTAHPSNENIAYIVARENNIGGQKVYMTNNKGVLWNNISGNLPNSIPFSDIIPHPVNSNLLYLSSEAGCYRSTNAGTTWSLWNNGMPKATIITELKGVDSLSINGKYYIIAGTYGRSIWSREVSGDDPTGITSNEIPSKFSLSQNFPNPFNPITTIKYSLPKSSTVKLHVYNITGKLVSVLVNNKQPAGEYEINFSGNEIASGVYFYKIDTEGFSEIKKMMLVK